MGKHGKTWEKHGKTWEMYGTSMVTLTRTPGESWFIMIYPAKTYWTKGFHQSEFRLNWNTKCDWTGKGY
jgi:hypothetical protein